MTSRIVALNIALVAVATASLAASGCGSGSNADNPRARFGERTTVNGATPPGELAPVVETRTMLDTVTADGDRLLVTRGVRKAGTRAGIHVHEWGGYTCVLAGDITDFVEGKKPAVFPAGSCYYMPPNTPMTAANLGTTDAVLIDNFAVPVGGDPMTILEPGYPGGPGPVTPP